MLALLGKPERDFKINIHFNFNIKGYIVGAPSRRDSVSSVLDILKGVGRSKPASSKTFAVYNTNNRFRDFANKISKSPNTCR